MKVIKLEKILHKGSNIVVEDWMNSKDGKEFVEDNHDGLIWDREMGYVGIHGVALALAVALEDISTRAISQACVDVEEDHIKFSDNMLSVSLTSQDVDNAGILEVRNYIDTHIVPEGNFEFIDDEEMADDAFVDLKGLNMIKDDSYEFYINLSRIEDE